MDYLNPLNRIKDNVSQLRNSTSNWRNFTQLNKEQKKSLIFSRIIVMM